MTEWKLKLKEATCDKVLKTIDKILDEANGKLDDDELDKLKDCWHIMSLLQDVK